MEKRLAYRIPVVLFLGAALAVFEQQARASVGPVHHYTFNNGTAQDSAGNADGTLKGDAQIVGGSLVLSGNGWMEMPGSVIANTGEVSLATWFASNTMGKTGRYMLACFGGTGSTYLFMTPTWTDGKARAAFAGSVVSSQGRFDDGSVHCMVCTVDATRLTLYIDGVMVGFASLSSGSAISDISQAYAYLGKSVFSSDPLWMGMIHEFAIYDRALSASEIKSNCIPVSGALGPADHPDPGDGEVVTGEVNLSWTPGEGAKTQDLYFGANVGDVNAAGRTNPMGVLVRQAADANDFHLAGPVQPGQTYYWRVDSVGSTGSITKGHVWSFTVGYPFRGLTHVALGSAKLTAGAGDTLIVSNIGSSGQDGVRVLLPEDMAGYDANWADIGDPNTLPEGASLKWTVNGIINGVEQPVTIVRAEKSNEGIVGDVAFPALDAKSVMIDFYYKDERVHSELLGGHTPGVPTRFVRIPLDFHIHVQRCPWRTWTELTWFGRPAGSLVTPGGMMLDHVDRISMEPVNCTGYLDRLTSCSMTVTHVPAITIIDEQTLPGNRPCDCDYYLDSFETYNDFDNKIFDTWKDGRVNGSGSRVGYANAPYSEWVIVHCPKQSMPFFYDNSTGPGYSETQRSVLPEWPLEDANCLSLWFYGDPCNAPAPLYVALEDIGGQRATVFHPDPAATIVSAWRRWTIPLSCFGGLKPSAVNKIIIGVSNLSDPKAGGKGKIYIDDICLIFGGGTASTGGTDCGGGCQCGAAGARITPTVATASSSSDASTGPEKTIDGSGLNALGAHSTAASDMWLSSKTDPGSIWILYEFECVYKLHEMQVWNYNSMLESFLGFGAKDVVIECSIDGSTWTMIGSGQFAQATGEPSYTCNTTAGLGDSPAKYVRLTIKSTWGGLSNQAGLSEVRFFCTP